MHKFPSIEQFRHVIRAVRDRAEWQGINVPTLKFRGTVKLHGTNASISNVIGSPEINFHSRSRTLTEGDDNMGFRTSFVTDAAKMLDLRWWFDNLREDFKLEDGTRVTVFGEWCGRGIQKGVAISNIEPRFIAFAVAIAGKPSEDANEDTSRWLDINGLWSANSAFDFITEIVPSYEIDIDFNQPELSQNALVDMTIKVEECCPVGKEFGHEGVGEGIVWQPIDPEWNSSRYWFKVKGTAHSVSKVKTLAPVDVERLHSMNEFVESTVTENRLNQGIAELKEQGLPIDSTSIGHFIRWIFNDVMKEEADTLAASGLNSKDLGKPISTKARQWFLNSV